MERTTMKIRNGFVSNSSSSSFVVAFPKKPQSEADVLKYMFDGKEGGLSLEYYENGYSYRQICEQVYKDILNQENKESAEAAELQDMFYSRYIYYPDGGNISVFFDYNAKRDDKGRWCVRSDEKYFGTDEKALVALRDLIIETKAKSYKFDEDLGRLLDKSGINKERVSFAYDDKKGTYTAKQIKASLQYEKKLENFKTTNKEYVALEKERISFLSNCWEEEGRLGKEVALADAKAFLNDHKKAFVTTFTYGDKNGEFETILECANIFRNLPHVVINGH